MWKHVMSGRHVAMVFRWWVGERVKIKDTPANIGFLSFFLLRKKKKTNRWYSHVCEETLTFSTNTGISTYLFIYSSIYLFIYLFANQFLSFFLYFFLSFFLSNIHNEVWTITDHLLSHCDEKDNVLFTRVRLNIGPSNSWSVEPHGAPFA